MQKSRISELSIIIPTLNEEDYISDLLDSIVAQNFKGKLEVIVVDGRSEDDTVQVIQPFKKKLDVTVVSSERSIGLQRNIGAAKAKYKYIFFVDADCKLSKNFLFKMQKKVRFKEDFLVSCIVIPSDGNLLDNFVIAILYSIQFFRRIFNPVLSGACILTTKNAHEQIKGFNPKILLGEDYDYGTRLFKQGIKRAFFYSPHMKSSVRRARETGRFKLIMTWHKSYKHQRKHGPLEASGIIEYPFGHYNKKGDR